METAQSSLPISEWTELRDERGKLCARLEPRLFLLEIHRNHGTTVFDLRRWLIYYLYPVSIKESNQEYPSIQCE